MVTFFPLRLLGTVHRPHWTWARPGMTLWSLRNKWPDTCWAGRALVCESGFGPGIQLCLPLQGSVSPSFSLRRQLRGALQARLRHSCPDATPLPTSRLRGSREWLWCKPLVW